VEYKTERVARKQPLRRDDGQGRAGIELEGQAEMAAGVCKPFDRQSYREGHMTPVLFGSALRHFGVKELLDTICAGGACAARSEGEGEGCSRHRAGPENKEVTGFVFKIQANMDPNHRDRIAFFRVVSGRFQRGMRLKTVAGKQIGITSPVMFMAQDREIADEAFGGDVIGMPNHGQLRVGDALSENGNIQFAGIPNFAPEILRRVRTKDPMKSKHLRKALEGLAEEGVTQLFTPEIGSDMIVGAVGAAADRGDGRTHRDGEQSRSAVRGLALGSGALAVERGSPEAGRVPRDQPQRRRQGPRRRAGLPREEHVGCRLRLRKESGDPVHEDERAGLKTRSSLPGIGHY
jgi:peptide subunit release factor RF-3